MTGKRHPTEEKIRILRDADGGKSIVELCREKNFSEQTFHRWKPEFGMMEIPEARQLKELEKENTELKKMLADSLGKNRVLEIVQAEPKRPGSKYLNSASTWRPIPKVGTRPSW